MRFQIGRLIGDSSISRGVALVKAVLGEEHHLVKQFIGDLFIHAAFRCTFHEDAAMLLHLRHLFLTHRTTQQIGFSKRITSQILCNAHDLLLIHHDPVGFTEDRFQGAVGEVDGFATVLAVDELGNQSRIQRAGSVERQDRGDIFQRRWLQITDDLTHPRGFKLENPFKISASQQVKGAFILRW